MSTLQPSDHEKKAENAGLSGRSSATHAYSASTFESEKKKTDNASNGSGSEDVVNSSATVETGKEVPDDDDDDYPKGLPLFFIVLALGMSVFLVALDMVCFAISQ
jgi:hypothetical protein